MNPAFDLTSFLVQVPLVAIFIWFALRLNADHQKAVDKLVSDQQQAVDKIVVDNRASSSSVMVDWRKYLKDRDEQWIQFLIEQRSSQNATMDMFSQRLSDLSHVVSDLDRHVRSKT